MFPLAPSLIGDYNRTTPPSARPLAEFNSIPKTQSSYHLVKCGSFRTPLSRFESLDEEEEDDDSNDHSSEEASTCIPPVYEQLPNVPKLTMSLKGMNLTEKASRYQGGFLKGDNSPSKSNNGTSQGLQFISNSRSADEQISSSANFVKLADMGEEYVAFLEKVQELLQGVFHDRKSRRMSQR